MIRIPAVPALMLIIGLGGAAPGIAQQTMRGNPPLAIDSLHGPDLFKFYCAPCHGRDGKGRGPVAAALRSAPADLTEIARRNGGTFPARRVEAFVTDGGPKTSPAHGTAEMPVWGPIFRSLDPSDVRVKFRIARLVEHVESIQVK